MRAAIDPIYLGEVVMERMTKLDQLTIVRNHARRGFLAHEQDVNGERVTEVEVEVGWLDGDVETLVFNRAVGFPIVIEGEPATRDWYAEWREETLSAEAQ